MKQIRFYPYKMGSRGVSQLAEAVRGNGVRAFKVYPNRGYQPRANHLIINWGNSAHPRWLGRYTRIINKPDAVSVAGNKLEAFRVMQRAGVQVPDFTTRWGEADDWMQQDNHTIVVRRILRGHSGAGITVVKPNTVDLPEAPLYVKYMKKKSEYRVHVFQGEVIDIQQKRKRRENGEVDYQVRNHHNGWVFCRDNIDIPHSSVREQAIAAVAALGLDFGAVDVIWNAHYEVATVLEVNTAPGLEGTTLTNYARKIRRLANVTS